MEDDLISITSWRDGFHVKFKSRKMHDGSYKTLDYSKNVTIMIYEIFCEKQSDLSTEEMKAIIKYAIIKGERLNRIELAFKNILS